MLNRIGETHLEGTRSVFVLKKLVTVYGSVGGTQLVSSISAADKGCGPRRPRVPIDTRSVYR